MTAATRGKPRPVLVKVAPSSQTDRTGEPGRRFAGQLGFWDFRDRLAADLRAGRTGQTAAAIVAHAHRAYGLDQADAAEWTERFLAHIRRELQRMART